MTNPIIIHSMKTNHPWNDYDRILFYEVTLMDSININKLVKSDVLQFMLNCNDKSDALRKESYFLRYFQSCIFLIRVLSFRFGYTMHSSAKSYGIFLETIMNKLFVKPVENHANLITFVTGITHIVQRNVRQIIKSGRKIE